MSPILEPRRIQYARQSLARQSLISSITNDKTTIEALQPYHTTIADTTSIISILHEMNIRDKHKELLLCRQMFKHAKLTFIEDVPGFVSISGPALGGTLDERTILYWLETTPPLDDSKVYMDTEITLQIMFDQSCFSGFKRQERVIEMTGSIINGTEIVLNHLEASVI